MISLDLLTSERLCLTLLHSLWQMALLALSAWGIGHFLGRRRDGLSYTIHTTALILGMLALPSTYVLLSPSSSNQGNELSSLVSVPTGRISEPKFELQDQSGLMPWADTGKALLPTELRAGKTKPIASASHKLTWKSLIPWFSWAYLFGVAVMLVRLVKSAIALEHLRAKAKPIFEGPAFDSFALLCKQWSLKAKPALAHAEQVCVPKVIGLLKPTILLPSSALTGLSIEELQLILAHELAHVRRYDLWVNLLQRLSEAVLFFNPPMWWLSRRISTLREYCCDDRACSISSDEIEPKLKYAKALLHAVELPSMEKADPATALAASGRSPSELRRRVARLFGEPLYEPIRLSRGGVAVLLAGALLLLVPPTVADSSASNEPSTQVDQEDEIDAKLPPTDADRAVAEARKRTFGLHDVESIAFKHIYRQVDVPQMHSFPNDNLESLWKARDTQVADAEFDRNLHEYILAWKEDKLLLESFTDHRAGQSWRQTHYWNGQEGWLGDTSVKNQTKTKNVYRYSDTGKLFNHIAPYSYPQWAAAGDRLPWGGPKVQLDEHGVDPVRTNYQLVGTDTIDGIICDIYNGPERHEKIWVARGSGLIKAASKYYVKGHSLDESWEILNQITDKKFKDRNDYAAWYEEQSIESKNSLSEKWSKATWKQARPGNLTIFSDYRDVQGVQWPHAVDRVVVHRGDHKNNTFKYFLSKIKVVQPRDFDFEEHVRNALPDPGVRVTDRTGEVPFDYEFSHDLEQAYIDRFRLEKIEKVRAKKEEVRLINEKPINSVADAIEILNEGPETDPTIIWARAIKYLTEHSEQSLPELIESLDNEKRDHPIRKLAFTLRAIGDARAVPALIRALPRTLLPASSDYGLRIDDVELSRFMQKHDNGRSRGKLFTYGRAFREVVFALRTLTGQQFNEMELNGVNLEGSKSQRLLAKQQFNQVTQKWAVWWEANWESKVNDSAYSKVDLPEPTTRVQKLPTDKDLPRGDNLGLIKIVSGATIQSVHDTGNSCFLDLDTNRSTGWPDELPPFDEIGIESAELRRWCHREGYDVIGITHTPEGETEPLYCLLPVGIRAWKITESELRNFPEMMRGKIPYPLSQPVEILIPRRTLPEQRDPEHSGDSFLFLTREGTAGILRLTAQVTEAKDISGRLSSRQDLFEQVGFVRGVKYVLSSMAQKEVSEATPVPALEVKPSKVEPQTEADADLREMRIRILDDAGNPLEGAKLHTSVWYTKGYKGLRTPKEHVADSKGTVVLQLPRQLRILRLWPYHAGYVGEFKNFALGTHREGELIPEDYEFRLSKGHKISGLIVDEEGHPIEDVHVRVRSNNTEPAWGTGTKPMVSTWLSDSFGQPKVITDAQGRWQINNAPAFSGKENDVSITLKLSHDDYISDEKWGDAQQAQGVSTADFRNGDAKIVLQRGVSISGVVTDLDGNTISKGWVVWHDMPYFNDGVFEMEIDENGSFQTPPLKAGEHPITIVAPGYAAQRRVVNVKPGLAPLRFELKPGKRIELQFMDKTGKPIPRAWVWLANSSDSNTWQGSNALHNHKHPNVPLYGIPRNADDNGVYIWDWAPEESIRFTVGAKGFAGQEVSLIAKSEPHIITLNEARVVTGQVTDMATGQLIKKFQVMPVIVFRPNFFSTWHADEKQSVDGQYELPLTGSSDPTSRYRIRVEADGYRSIVSEESYGPKDGRAKLDLQLDPAPLRTGRVIDANGKPVSDAIILEGTPTWVPHTNNGEPDSYGARFIRTDIEGRFSINATSEPTCIRAVHDLGIFEKLVEPDAESFGDMQLSPWASASGRLMQEGKPIGNQSIYFWPLVRRGLGEARFQDSYQTRTSPDGTFSFKRLPPGAGSIRASLGPWRESPLTSSEGYVIELEPGESREVELGGDGAVVTGQVVVTGRDEAPLNRNWSLNYLVSRDQGVGPPYPVGFPSLSFNPTGPIRLSWCLDPHFNDWVTTRNHHFVKLTPDGNLRVTGVAPGEYDLVLRLYEQPAGCLVETVGEKVVPVSVDKKGTIDLGVIEVPCRAGPRIGSDMRAFEFVDAAERKLSVGEMAGQYIMLHVWASWCAPCLATMPELKAESNRLSDLPITFIGLNIDSDSDSARRLVNKKGWSWAQNYLGDDSDLARQLAISSVPMYYLIGPDGHLVGSSTDWKEIKKTANDVLYPRIGELPKQLD